jgi:hypothetical protein
MATSPIYNWPEPDNTDLVKNGALAMRTLGNAIDTTMATMTPKSTVTAKGSLIAATAASTPANLAVGNNGETLVADSSTSTGLRYTAGNPISNPILNSCFDIAQRGTSVAVNAALAYSLDRWQSYYAGNLTISRQATGDTTNLPFIQYCARFQRNAGQTNTTGTNFNQNLETVNSISFAGKTVTFSFYARKGANYSPTSDLLTYALISGTGTDQNYLSSWTGSSNVVFAVATLTSTWQRFTATGTVSASATQLTVNFSNTPTGTAGANDYYEVTGVQVDIGSVALPVRRNGATIQGELAACQRYFQAYTAGTTYAVFNANLYTTTSAYGVLNFPVIMRTSPTLTVSSSAGLNVLASGSQRTSTGITGGGNTYCYEFSITVSAWTQGIGGWVRLAGVSDYVQMSAEL